MKKIPKVIGVRVFLIGWLLSFLLVIPYVLVTIYHKLPEFLEAKNIKVNKKEELGDEKGFDSLIGVQENTLLLYDSLQSVGDTISLSSAINSPDIEDKDTVTDGSLDTINDNIVANDSISKNSGLSIKLGDKGDLSSENSGFVFLFFLFSIISLLIYIWPIKKFFKGLRKGPLPTEKLRTQVKKRIYKLPIVATLLFMLPSVTQRMYEAYNYFLVGDNLGFIESLSYSKAFFITSIIGELVTVIFVYQWFQYKVQTQYLEHILSVKELIFKDKKFFTGKIRNRLWTSSLMTTLLPILIVFLYITINMTHLPEIPKEAFSDELKLVLVGDYLASNTSIEHDSIPSWMFYFNIPNSLLMVFGMISSMIVAFIYVYFFIRWTTARIVVPIHDLLEKMHLVQNGDFSSYTYIRTPDEMGRLTSGYNEMVTKLGIYFNDVNEMKDSYRRFVPQQFLDFLGKEKFSDIVLGDQVEKEMSVLFTDIRDFTSISEKMTPQQNFNFINAYLSYMEPVISKHNGFIDKYIGDAIMALFPDSPDDAINAALEMQVKLEEFNKFQTKKGKPCVKIGVGIHTGRLMLGVIGGANRMEGTVISDSVNLASRLEGLTKKYKKTIVISKSTKDKLNKIENFEFEFLGEIKVKGKQQATKIYSVSNLISKSN